MNLYTVSRSASGTLTAGETNGAIDVVAGAAKAPLDMFSTSAENELITVREAGMRASLLAGVVGVTVDALAVSRGRSGGRSLLEIVTGQRV